MRDIIILKVGIQRIKHDGITPINPRMFNFFFVISWAFTLRLPEDLVMPWGRHYWLHLIFVCVPFLCLPNGIPHLHVGCFVITCCSRGGSRPSPCHFWQESKFTCSSSYCVWTPQEVAEIKLHIPVKIQLWSAIISHDKELQLILWPLAFGAACGGCRGWDCGREKLFSYIPTRTKIAEGQSFHFYYFPPLPTCLLPTISQGTNNQWAVMWAITWATQQAQQL